MWKKLVVPLLAVALATDAAPIGTCLLQSACMKLSFTKETVTSDTVCKSGGCQYTVCLELDTNADGCDKAGASISHSCAKSSSSCLSSTTFSGATYADKPGDGFTQCQTGVGGSTLYFLLKDGSGCNNASQATFTVPVTGISAGSTAVTCQGRPKTITSCTGNAEGVECIWSVVLPTCSNFVVTETPSCTDILSNQVPPNYLKYDSGEGPPCPIESAESILNNCCNCRRPSGCQFLVCDDPIPDEKKALLDNMLKYGEC